MTRAFPSLLLSALLVLLSLSSQSSQAADRSGQVVSYVPIGHYDEARLDQILNEELRQFLEGSTLGFQAFENRFDRPKNGIDLFKLTYSTFIPEQGNRPVLATGLVAIPSVQDPHPAMLSYQHGTVFGKEDVPSRPENSAETRLALAVFGGQGYVVIAADYPGLGDSDVPNSYFVEKTTEQSMFDLHQAALAFLKERGRQPSGLAVLGWSQGGYNNMVFLRRLEHEGIAVKAAVSAAAPVDVQLFLVRGLTNPRPFDAVYGAAGITNMLFAIESYNNLTDLTKRAIKPEYLEAAREFFEFKIDFPNYLSRTTSGVREILNPSFVDELIGGMGVFTDILNQSEAYRWLSKTPFRVYYGGRDEAVPGPIPGLAVIYQSFLGKTDATAMNAGDKADHRSTYVYALQDGKSWIDEAFR